MTEPTQKPARFPNDGGRYVIGNQPKSAEPTIASVKPQNPTQPATNNSPDEAKK